jgi:myo-inositol-1(or 4)-monophosphatase
MSRELAGLAARLAEQAGAQLLAARDDVHAVATKSSGTDPVSEADRASEALLVRELRAARPDDGLLGEEGAQREGGSGLRWVVDPLDGTVNYLYGLPGWAVSVACERREGDGWAAVAGAVHHPLSGETFRAWRGGGAWLGERRLAVNDPVALERALVGTGFGYRAEVRHGQAAVVAALLPRVRDVRRIGSAALDLCLVAAGRLDGFYEDTLGGPWDWSAGALVATEAGATVTPLHAPEGGQGVLAAGPALHEALSAAVRRA